MNASAAQTGSFSDCANTRPAFVRCSNRAVPFIVSLSEAFGSLPDFGKRSHLEMLPDDPAHNLLMLALNAEVAVTDGAMRVDVSGLVNGPPTRAFADGLHV